MDFSIELLPVLLFLIAPVVFWIIVVIKWPKEGGAALACDLLVYILLSLQGEYVVSNHGGADWNLEWCPKGLAHGYVGMVGRHKTTYTMSGLYYFDCILIDRWLWHPTDWDYMSHMDP